MWPLLIIAFFLLAADAQTVISGTISEDQTWTESESPYDVRTTTVAAGVTVTIESGVVLQIRDYENITVHGTLVADGTSGSEIVFTSISGAEAGNPWAAIRLTNNEGAGGQDPSVFRHCVFEGGGHWWRCLIQAYGSVPVSFEDCTFQHSREDALRLHGTSPTIKNCVFRDNVGDAVQLESSEDWGASYPTFVNTTFEGGGKVHITGNLHSSGTLSATTYVISSSTGIVPDDVELRIEAGTTLAFTDYTSWEIRGNVLAEGTNNTPIIFTSLSGAGENNPWGAVRLVAGSERESHFEHCVFEGGGHWFGCLVDVIGGVPFTFENCTFQLSREDGLRLRGASPTIRDSVFRDNTGDGVQLESTEDSGASYPTFVSTSFEGNEKVHIVGSPLSSGKLSAAPYVISNATGFVPLEVELQIEAGTTLAFTDYTSWEIRGNIIAEATSNAPVVFTSLSGAGANNPWGALRIVAGSDRESLFEHTLFEGGGHWFGCLVDIVGPADVLFNNCRFEKSSAYGLGLRSASPSLTSCKFAENANAIRLESSAEDGASYPVIRDTEFAGTNRIHLRGEVHSSGVLSRGPYLIDGSTGAVAAAAEVTIEAGSHFSMVDYGFWNVHGNLMALGTAEASITFTSLSGAGQGNPWGAVRLSNGEEHGRVSAFDHCVFEGGGYWHNTQLHAYGHAKVAIRDSIFRLSIEDGIRFDSGSGGSVTRCSFVDNARHGLKLQSSSPAIEGCSFTNNASGAISLHSTEAEGGSFPQYAGNQFGFSDKIEIATDIHSSGVLPNAGTPYILRSNRTILNPAEVEIDPGVVVEFGDWTSLLIRGSLAAKGNGADQVLFTSDDAIKAPGQWGGLVYTSDRTQPSYLHGCQIECGGYWYGALVEVSGAQKVEMNGCLMRQSSADGIQLLNGSNVTVRSSSIFACNGQGVNAAENSSRVEGCDIFGNGANGIYSSKSSLIVTNSLLRDNGGSGLFADGEPVPAVVDSVILGNAVHGINNRGPATLLAPNNWWGTPTGPFHATLNPTGTGNPVSDRVEFRPFRTVTRDVPKVVETQLQNGVAVEGTFTRDDNAVYYTATVAAGNHLALTFDDVNDTGFTQIYLSRGAFPTPVDYQIRHEMNGADQSIFVPGAGPGTWYILVVQFSAEETSNYTLRADIGEIFINGISPQRHANTVPIVMTVTGAGFGPGADIELVSGANTYPAASVDIDSPNQITATFAAGSVPVGTHDVRVSVPGKQPTSLPSAFEAVAGGQPRLVTNLVVPQRVGYHQIATVYVEYSNKGEVAMPAPLLIVSAFQNGNRKGLLTLDPSRLTSGFWTSAVPDGFGASVQILASGKTPGVLQPGESGQIPVFYAGWRQPWDFSYPPIEFGLSTLTAEDNRPIDWGALRQAMLPNGMNAEAFEIVWNNFRQGIGDRVGDFVSVLGENAAFLGRQGHSITDVDVLTRFEFAQAEGFAVRPFAAEVSDLDIVTPGLPLTFQRFYPTWTSGRLRSGDLGRGWLHNWSFQVDVLQDGTVEISFPKVTRRFQPDTRGGYLSASSDRGKLRKNGDEFVLSEPEGLRYGFSNGQLAYMENPNGVRITASYAGGHLSRLEHSNGRSIQIQRDGAGKIVGLTDPYNRQTSLQYAGGNLASVTRPNGASMSLSYFGSAEGSKAHSLKSMSEGGNRHRYFEYDARGRLTETGFNGGSEQTTYSYDSAGTVTMTDALGRRSSFSFDHHGEPARMSNPLGATIVFRRNAVGQLEEMIDPYGFSTSYAYDSAGQLSSITNPVGAVQQLDYDRNSKLVQSTDPLGYAKRFEYDAKGNVQRVVYPDGSSRAITYGDSGEVTSVTNGRGQIIDYAYNAQGHLIRKDYPDGTVFEYHYDAKDRLIRIVDPTGETLLGYDDSDRLERATYPDGRFLEYQYDGYDRRTMMKDQDDREIRYHYDASGRLAEMRDKNNDPVVTYTYDAAGQVTRETFGDGRVNTYAYNEAGLVTEEVRGDIAKDADEAGTFVTEYDLNGRSVSSSTPDGVWTMGYDPAGRLTDASLIPSPGAEPQSFNYQYDLRDRWIQTTIDGVENRHATNENGQYVQAGNTSYTYDADGNMTSQRSGDGAPTQYGYDPENRVTTVSAPATDWTGNHNGLGNLTSIEENGSTTTIVHDLPSPSSMSHEYGSDGSLLSWHAQGLRNHALLQTPQSFISAAPPARVAPPELRAARFQSSVVDRNGVPQVPSSTLRPGNNVSTTDILSNFHVNQISNWLGIAADGSVLATMRLGRFAKWPSRFRMDPKIIVRVGGNSLRAAATYGTAIFTVVGGGYEFLQGYRQGGVEGSRQMWHGGGYTALGVISIALAAGVAPAAAPFVLGAAVLATVSDLAGELGVLESFWIWWDDLDVEGGYQTHPSQSSDPNQKLGPAGFGDAHFVGPGALLPYRVDFENDKDATAPAQVVMVTDPLSDSVDWSSLSLTETGFGDHLIAIPTGSQQFETTEFMTFEEKDLEVSVSINFDPVSGIITAIFATTDVETGLPPAVTHGFLPPEDGSGRGLGHFSYVVRAKEGLPTGTEIRNIATITFDFGEVIDTNQVDPHDPSQGTDPEKEALVTIDGDKPVTSVTALPATSASNFTVRWSGNDGSGSGLARYSVFVKEGGGGFELWLQDTPDESASFQGINGRRYEFYSIGIDWAGNEEGAKANGEAVTTATGGADPYDGWTAVHFTAAEIQAGLITDRNADPDDDGASNFSEFAFLTNPRQSDAPFIETNHDNARFSIIWNRRKSGVIYEIEQSSNLRTWLLASGLQEIILTDDVESERVESSVPAGAGRTGYLRVRAEAP